MYHAPRNEPPLSILDYLRYDDGRLYWKKADYPRTQHLIGKRAGTKDNFGYRKITYLTTSYKEHHIVWLIHTGEWPTAQVDHVNNIRDDNRIENLRLVTTQQNNHHNKRRELNVPQT